MRRRERERSVGRQRPGASDSSGWRTSCPQPRADQFPHSPIISSRLTSAEVPTTPTTPMIPQLSNAGAIALCTIARRSICRAERSLSSVSAWHQQVVGTVTVRQLNLLPAAAGGADGGDGSTRYLTGWCRACIPYSAVQYSTVQVQQYSLCRCRCRALRTLLYCSRAL